MSVVAIVGRPNVGKSTIFNILTRSKSAIVADFSGLTRDRKYGTIANTSITLIDTGGLNEDSDNISNAIKEQADLAIEEADYILFVVDAIDGLLPLDREIAKSLRKQNKEITLLINKTDNARLEESSADFNSLGFKKSIFLSASHNKGFGDLRDLLSDYDELVMTDNSINEDSSIKISIIGRPNAGKSTFINKFINEDRLIVSEIAGTTIDAISIPFTVDDQDFIFIDTAGIRKGYKNNHKVEYFSYVRAMHSVEECDVVIFICDAQEGIVDQDLKIINMVC